MTKIKERTYIVITAEATPMDAKTASRSHVSATVKIDRRMDNPWRSSKKSDVKADKKADKKAEVKADKKADKKPAKKGNK